MSPGEPVASTVDGSVARITIDRPDRRNAISPEVIRGLGGSLMKAESDPAVRAVVLTGAGDRSFCAGADLGEMSAEAATERHLARAELGDLVRQMRASPLPIVARVNGHALAGGFGLMLACDLVVAVEDAQMGMPEVNLGLWPFMITAVVQRDVPRKLALELMLTGRRLSATEALAVGVVNRVVPRTELDAAVDALTAELASKSRAIVGLGKRSFYRAEDMTTDAALEYLAGMLTLCLETEDTVEGVSAFLQKRAPEWKDR